MRYFVLPALALAGVAIAAEPDEERAESGEIEIAAEATPCDGSVPVFNPEGCPENPIAVAECEQTITQVREANGQPSLRREGAAPEDAELIAAVDHRIEGCSVIVMQNDTSDVRPMPEPDDRVELIPAG